MTNCREYTTDWLCFFAYLPLISNYRLSFLLTKVWRPLWCRRWILTTSSFSSGFRTVLCVFKGLLPSKRGTVPCMLIRRGWSGGDKVVLTAWGGKWKQKGGGQGGYWRMLVSVLREYSWCLKGLWFSVSSIFLLTLKDSKGNTLISDNGQCSHLRLAII